VEYPERPKTPFFYPLEKRSGAISRRFTALEGRNPCDTQTKNGLAKRETPLFPDVRLLTACYEIIPATTDSPTRSPAQCLGPGGLNLVLGMGTGATPFRPRGPLSLRLRRPTFFTDRRSQATPPTRLGKATDYTIESHRECATRDGWQQPGKESPEQRTQPRWIALHLDPNPALLGGVLHFAASGFRAPPPRASCYYPDA